MCVDFKDLNKACPKDGYPLPEIDWKVESLCRYPFKCFLDAYKGYHQIKMAKEDEEKITFITSQGILCYSKMPFGLKNVRATYQRLVDKAFQKQIGRNLEVFLAKSAEKSLPFFKTLKKCTKKSDFQWTAEAGAAFKQMKKLIEELPTLTAPMEKEELIVYLEASREAMSTILITEREAKQMPIYFVSRTLQGPEINYTPMEMLVLALVHVSKQLKMYFQAHPIIVITDQPIKQVLSKPEITGRLQKWSIELGEYDIQYRPRISVKGQVLVDFIVERPKDDSSATPMEVEEELPEPWILFTDESFCIDGSGAGLILTDLEGTKFTYALRFRFNATNNEAEYEALIVDLRIAEQIGVKNLQTHVDSRLVANQINVSYTAKEPGMMQYLEKVKMLASNFKKFSIKNPQQKLTPITSPWPFYKWGIDIAGPFLKGPGKVKFLIVAMDYFTKWIEVNPVAAITGNLIKKFVWDNIVCRFGLPGEIISDNGKQFRDNPFKDWCEKLNIRQRFAFVKHPQANGLVERANRSLGEGVKARLDKGSKDWIEEIPHVLWAHRTMIKLSNGDTPFSLTYGTEVVIPAEIDMPTLRTAEVDMVQNDEALKLNLDLLEEKREQAAIREARSKAKIEKYYNSKVRNTSFKPGDLVYQNNDARHADKPLAIDKRATLI
ncbi:reverse transcriptase domain-containing protein [Tanacetum coccineum]